MSAAAVAFALTAILARAPAQAAQPEEARERARAALARDPRQLARAPRDRWSAWRASDAVPDDLRVALARGIDAYRQGDHGLALDELLGLLEREPDFPPALYQASSAYFRLRRYGDCAALLERFVEVAPSETGATQALGHSYYSLGDYERARAHYERVVERAPASAEAWRGLGLSHLRLGDAERALRCLDRTIDLRPDHGEAHVWRARALLDLDRSGDALASAERARELAPHDSRPWFVLAQVFSELDRGADAAWAKARFEELSRIEQHVRAQEGLLLHDPRAVEPLQRLVALHAAARDSEALEETARRLLRAAPASLEAHVAVLGAWALVERREEAARAAQAIEAKFPDRADAWRTLERYYADAGDRDGVARAAARLRALTGGG
jgi:tetratricopeptide (TPR) repeat protein